MRKWLKYNLSYLKRPPWDTQQSPPELLAFIASHSPARAIDMGCGTGTNVLTLAQAGWTVLGIDFGLLAVINARKKNRNFSDQTTIRYGDVSNLKLTSGCYQLVLDIGCFHGLNRRQKASYITNLTHILARDGYFLMYAHWGNPGENNKSGILLEDVKKLKANLDLIEQTDGFDPGGQPASWLVFKRKTHPDLSGNEEA